MVYERLPRDESPAGAKIRDCSRFEKRWDCSKRLLQNSRIFFWQPSLFLH